jgi:hypothetical protein
LFLGILDQLFNLKIFCMKIDTKSILEFLGLKGVFFICLSLFFTQELFGQTVTITGPTTVCPNNFHPNGTIGNTYTAKATLLGQEINCTNWQWIISENGFGVASGLGNVISNYAFPGVGTYRIQFFTSCGPDRIETNLYVTSRVKMPSPIRHVTAPIMCNPGQVYTYESYPALGLDDQTCYYHYEYYWTAPAGWNINNGGTNTFFGHGATADIVAPANTPSGSYTISVESTIPNGQPGPFPNNRFRSPPINYTVQVGPINSSQIYAFGTSSVCNGNSYTYTGVVPGGHQNGYSYSWTYPSGWSVQSTNANTITLYVPTYNSSYGPVRFSVATGCGPPSGYSGITTYPCNNMYGNFMVYPNPVEGELNVEYISPEDVNASQNGEKKTETSIKSLSQDGFRVELYDKDQKMVKIDNSKLGKVTIETNGLQPGSYFLYIYFGKEVSTQQIIVK